MDEDKTKLSGLIDTTDNLEAVNVCKTWKSGLFVIIIVCLVLLQLNFWLVQTGCIKVGNAEKTLESAQTSVIINPVTEPNLSEIRSSFMTDEVGKAAAKITAESNQPARMKILPIVNINITFEQVAPGIRSLNFVLMITAVLYSLTMLFIVKISLTGRLGGINHIVRAFFLSLVFAVLLMPWQKFFPGVVFWAIYTPEELLKAYTDNYGKGMVGNALYYLRFCGYSVLAVLFLIAAQIRSCRWARTILRRLEVAV